MLYKSFDEIGLEYVKSYTNFAFFKTGKHIDVFSKHFKIGEYLSEDLSHLTMTGVESALVK